MASQYTCREHNLINCSRCRKKVSIASGEVPAGQSFDELFYLSGAYQTHDMPTSVDSYTPSPPAESSSHDSYSSGSGSSYDSGSSSGGSDSGSSGF